MSKTDSGDKPKKGKGAMLKLVLGLVLVGAGGGGAYTLLASDTVGQAHASEDSRPQLVRKGDEDPYAPPPGKGEEEGVEPVHGEGGSEYRIAYYSFPEE